MCIQYLECSKRVSFSVPVVKVRTLHSRQHTKWYTVWTSQPNPNIIRSMEKVWESLTEAMHVATRPTRVHCPLRTMMKVPLACRTLVTVLITQWVHSRGLQEATQHVKDSVFRSSRYFMTLMKRKWRVQTQLKIHRKIAWTRSQRMIWTPVSVAVKEVVHEGVEVPCLCIIIISMVWSIFIHNALSGIKVNQFSPWNSKRNYFEIGGKQTTVLS